MDAPSLAAVLDSFRTGGRCESALLDRFAAALACPGRSHAGFWAAQPRGASSAEALLRFRRDGAAWVDAFPALVAAAFRLHGRHSQLALRLAEALVNTQEAHCVGVGLRCLEVALRALPPEELGADWGGLLKALFGLKASLQGDINLPLAIDRLLALFAVRRQLQSRELLDFLGAAELHEEPFFCVLREFVRLSLKEGARPALPAVPLPDLAQLSCAEVSKLACIALLQQRAEALQELLSWAEGCWTLQEVWQLVADIALFCAHTGLPPSEAFLAFALRLARDCLHSAAGLRRHRSRLEALLQTAAAAGDGDGAGGGEAQARLATELGAKFGEAFAEQLPTLTDLARLLRRLQLPAAEGTELLRTVLEAWRGAVGFQSDSDLASFCDAVLSAVRGAVASPEGWRLALRLLHRLLPDIEAALRAPERAYACHFFMFLWRDAAAAVSEQEVRDAAALAEAAAAGLGAQVRYGEAFCELDHFPCACFALLQGAAALLQVLPAGAGSPAEPCLRLCRLFERRSADAAFVDAVLQLALRCAAPEALWAAVARLCAAPEPVALQQRTLKALAGHFLALPEAEAAAHPLGGVLRAACRPEDALTAEELRAVERHMGRAWADGPVPGGGALCEACGENLAELCADVELALRCPLNLDCIGD